MELSAKVNDDSQRKVYPDYADFNLAIGFDFRIGVLLARYEEAVETS